MPKGPKRVFISQNYSFGKMLKGVPPPSFPIFNHFGPKFFFGVFIRSAICENLGVENFLGQNAQNCAECEKKTKKKRHFCSHYSSSSWTLIDMGILHVLRNAQTCMLTYIFVGIPTVKMRKNARACIWWHCLKTIKCANARMRAFLYIYMKIKIASM